MKTATPQDTFDHVFGSGALQWEWWLKTVEHNVSRGDVSADWSVDVTADDGNDSQVTVKVDHKRVMKTARYVLAHKGQTAPRLTPGTPYRAWSESLERECSNLIFRADEADFDAPCADELLQLAMLGEVVFG